MAKNETYYMQTATGEVFETTMPQYHPECTALPRSKGAEIYRKQTIEESKGLIKPGDTVYTLCESVSSSGMTRRIKCFIVVDGQIRDITYRVHVVSGYRIDGGCLIVQGCGMDMGFSVVYDFSSNLYREGFGVEGKSANGKPYRPATQKAAKQAVKRGVVFSGRNGNASGWDTNGGYALKQSWL